MHGFHKPTEACRRSVTKPIYECSSILIYCNTTRFVKSRVGSGSHEVFGIEPHKLAEASGGVIADLKRH
jgi:hypothetical protein